jgi:hypothetical protein
MDNEASADIEEAKCAKLETQEEALARRIAQLNAKKCTATDEVMKERVKIICTYSPVYCHCIKCSYFVIKCVVSYEQVLQV